mmetsp:Transcript_90340/g.195508  ORF Transcript_90340/g.195508 Transcript_90340/m.195508 type:complete len:242 (+) Transcript_90340:1-726(+)
MGVRWRALFRQSRRRARHGSLSHLGHILGAGNATACGFDCKPLRKAAAGLPTGRERCWALAARPHASQPGGREDWGWGLAVRPRSSETQALSDGGQVRPSRIRRPEVAVPRRDLFLAACREQVGDPTPRRVSGQLRVHLRRGRPVSDVSARAGFDDGSPGFRLHPLLLFHPAPARQIHQEATDREYVDRGLRPQGAARLDLRSLEARRAADDLGVATGHARDAEVQQLRGGPPPGLLDHDV